MGVLYISCTAIGGVDSIPNSHATSDFTDECLNHEKEAVMSDDVLVKVEGVSKKFCRSLKRSLWYGVQDVASEIIGRQDHLNDLRRDEFWAVNNVSFELRRGECLGLIGRNGAGKTTLLRILNGLIRPDTGRVSIRGYVSAMIALGAGGKDILTGRENIFAMAALRGMSRKEAESKLDEIVEFAEIADAIDAPLQTYSSGMRVRLNFAVSSALEPDVLLLDEVLAVGDASFRNKCYGRIADIRRQSAVIFVSHSMEQIARICNKTILISGGNIVHAGSVEDGIAKYEDLNGESSLMGLTKGSFLSLRQPISYFEAQIENMNILSGDSVRLSISFFSEQNLEDYAIKVLFYNSKGSFAADGLIGAKQLNQPIKQGDNFIHLQVSTLPLKNGHYAVAFNILDNIGDLIVWSFKNHTVQVVGAYAGGLADCQINLTRL